MIIEALNDYVAANRRKFEDRTDTVGASEVGLCARRIYFEKRLGRGHQDAVEGGWGADVRGTTMENSFWYPALKAKFGDKLLRAGPDQATLKSGKLSATPDGVLTGLRRDALAYLGVKDIGGSSIMVECKSIDPRVNLREAKRENVFQVQVQMGLIRELTDLRPGYALITYTDASFWDDVTEYAVKFDPKLFEVAKKRAETILGATDPTDLKPEGWIAGGRECEYCPYNTPCGILRRRVPDGRERDVDPQFAAEVTDLCREAADLRDQGKELDEKFRDLQDQIKDRLRSKGVRKIDGVVTWTPVKGRTTIDTEKLREELIRRKMDIADFQNISDPSDRLQILL